MNWLLWRQHRSQGLVTGVALALFAVVVVLTGVHMANTYNDALGTGGINPDLPALNPVKSYSMIQFDLVLKF